MRISDWSSDVCSSDLRDHHIVGAGRFVGAVAADAESNAGRGYQRFDPGFDQTGQWRRRNDGQLLRQVIALLRIEDREALQKRDRLGVLAGLAGALFLVVRHEAVGIDDGGAVLALADIAAEREALARTGRWLGWDR